MKWRYLLDDAASGAWNMAVDEALLESLAAALGSAPVLRFYDWQPACLSLGRFQSFESVLESSALLQRLTEARESTAEFGWVRRPTGGRAVWHQHEITYSAVIREDALPPDARSVAGAYRWLSSAFVAGLATLGVQAELAPAESREQRAEAQKAQNCFASATRCDFVVGQRKLIGAAQCRRNGAILQHGSILLDADRDAWQGAIGGAFPAIQTLKALGVGQSRGDIIDALARGVEQTLGVALAPDGLTESENT
ncbi:MAG TPA: hypothetical protein VF719_02350, partial [Abditibacteriaceae bacterium]